MYIPRAIEAQLAYLAEHFPVVLVTGARQTGKTTLLRRHVEARPEQIGFVTLDDTRLRALARQDPELFLQHFPAPLVIDEAQYAPELFPYIKIAADRERRPGRYWLTGSQMFPMMQGVSESLAGRVGILALHPLGRRETLGLPSAPFLPASAAPLGEAEDVNTVFQKIHRGGMPQMIADPALTPDAFYSAYVQTYIERDIRALMKVQDESRFLQFIACAAARTGQEKNIADMARDVGVNAHTAESWLSLLVSAGLVIEIGPYSGNTIKRIVKRPKLYFMDTGLACHLSLWNSPEALRMSAMAGPMFETWVVSEIVKSYANAGLDTRNRFCWYRDNNGREIDLMILHDGKIHPIEIKKSADPGPGALKHFGALSALREEVGEGAVICLSKEVIPLDRKNRILPAGCL